MLTLLLLLLVESVLSVDPCVDVYPYALDIGFYWASVSGVVDGTAQIAWTKSCIGNHAASFDPSKPSVIGVHGLQSDSVVQNVRFLINDTNDSILTSGVVAGWLSMGYNFGAFEWTQFADEPLTNFMRAEGKINATDFLANTEYVYLDRATGLLGAPADGPKISIAEYLYIHYADHFGEGSIPPRLYGHSLGTQLIVFFTELLITSHHDVVVMNPERIALLDPVFSAEAKPYFVGNPCGIDTSEVMGCYMDQILGRGIAIELYRSSFINRCIFSADNNAPLIANAASAALKFNEWGSQKDGYCWNANLMSHLTKTNIGRLSNQLYNQHRAVVGWYLASFLTPNPPLICIRKGDNRCDPTRSLALSAAMSTEDVLSWGHRLINDKAKACFYQFDEYASTHSVTPSDDLFFVDDCYHFNV